MQWYKDGSKTADGIGTGIVGSRIKLSVPIGRFQSNFQAKAINSCIAIIKEKSYHRERAVIFIYRHFRKSRPLK